MLRSNLVTCILLLQLTAAVAVPPRKSLVSRQYDSSNPYSGWPSYADLPLDPSYPTKAAWGVWGADDADGALNHITPSTITAASEEIRTGQAFNLNLEFSFIPRPITAERRPVVHLFQPGDLYTDDVITLNTQMSTQYDGLRHYPYSDANNNGGTNTSTWQFYNDLIPDYEDIVGYNHTSILGIQQAAEKGIAARGVLLDWAAWKESRNESFEPLQPGYVPVSDLQKVAEWQGLSGNWTRPGDVLLVRWGWIEAFGRLNDTEKQNLVLSAEGYNGLTANDASAEWLWDNKFSLVGSDCPAFEAQPFRGDFGGEDRSLHQILLAGWGTSILEFIDTERLASALHEVKRSHFFLTIQVLNVRGGIASPPNAMAIL